MAAESSPRRTVSGTQSLAPPENEELKRRSMERSPSMTMRAEKEDLKEAAEDSYNVIMDLNLDGKVRWVSPSWDTVIGTPRDSIQGRPISGILVDDKDAFQHAVEVMKNDDSRSYKLRFTVAMGSMSKLSKGPSSGDMAVEDNDEAFHMDGVPDELRSLTLEGQGILIYNRATGEPSHTMWVIRPYVEPTEITIDLPPVLVESLGVGAGMLARYLTSVAEQGVSDPANHPPPMPVLCRICERQIQPWWFEKHSELCMLEHKAESDVQLCQENLGIHRQAIVKILDAMERRSTRPVSGEMTQNPQSIEYRGLSIGPSSSSSSGTASPGTPPPARSREHSASGSRSRSFPARRPLVRIVELLLDLCDTAMEISTPAIKETFGSVNLGSFRTQSPESEARINQVMQWQSPSTNTIEEEKGLALLCQDTEAVARAKVEAVYRHRNTIEYSERIRLEFSMLVQDCIDEAIRKAAEVSNRDEMDDEYSNTSELDDESGFFGNTLHAALKRSNSSRTEPGSGLRHRSSPGGSGTSSPMECLTPRSQQSLHRATSRASRRARYSHRSSMQFEPEGADSDTSAKSSLAAAIGHAATDSPVSDHELTTRLASRERNRHSAYQPSLASSSPKRGASPARLPPSSSPLRISKPRTSIYDNLPTPITSPLLSTGDFSPALEHSFHHRRQSSATLSDQFVKGGTPSSPRLSSIDPSRQNRAVPPSIKDFEIIKPISKGAFGSVYLSKKKSTGDYYAIKVLKKADMIAKNQVTNVRAERAIMMVQGESDFVAKLFWTFASKDYLYLVMEYLNGGDCAALIKVLGGLPEDWARKYLAEVVLGVENLHQRGIVHRDLKPDNLLIDQKGHLKLTDFGLSRMGLIGRQKRAQAQNQSSESTPDLLKQGPFVRAKSVASSRSASFDFPQTGSPSNTPSMTPDTNAQLVTPSYFNLGGGGTLSRESSLRRSSNPRSETSGSDHLATMLGNFTLNEPPVPGLGHRRAPNTEDDTRSESSTSSDFSALGLQHVSHSSQSHVQQTQSMMPPQLALFNPDDSNNRKFVGTPDYLAPETINGTGQDETSDWWSVGCILFEFLYGYPPFHAGTPEQVFENILARRILWPEPEEDDASPEAKDLMNRLMCTGQSERLGANGGAEIKAHPFFTSISWDTLLEEEPQFVPTPQNPEDTEYFDARGATLQSFVEEMEGQSTPSSTPGADLPERPHDAVSRVRKDIVSNKRGLIPLSIPPHIREREGRNRRLSEPVAQDDFGNFAFKNLPVLDKANKDVIQKLRTEALKSTPALATSNPSSPSESTSSLSGKPLSRTLSHSSGKNGGKRAVSPSNAHTLTSSQVRGSQPSSPLLVSFSANPSDRRKMSSTSQSSGMSQHPNSNLPTSGLVDIPRLPTASRSQAPPMTSSPIKLHPKFSVPSVTSSPMSTSPTKTTHDKPQPLNSPSLSQKGAPAGANPRVRSLTVGSADSDTSSPTFEAFKQQKRRSQVFDMSPSSSDNEEVRSSALLRVQRRRQSARRMSNISVQDGPVFRALDVLVCEDHPVSRMVMERLLEKLKCRTIVVENGAEAMRYAMGEVKFDIILMEFKLPQINGEDVARMIRTTRNPNSSTPIVAVTGYLKDLSDPQHFDELMEKPATPSKLIDVLERQCFWKAPPPDRPPFGERKDILSSPSPAPASGRISPSVERFMTGARPRDSGQFPAADFDSASITGSTNPVQIPRTTAGEWGDGSICTPAAGSRPPSTLMAQETAPARLQSHGLERIPSPLSTQISASRLENMLPSLPSPPEMTPLPPSLTSTPLISTPAGDRSKSPLSGAPISAATAMHAQQINDGSEGNSEESKIGAPSTLKSMVGAEIGRPSPNLVFHAGREMDTAQILPSPPMECKSKKRGSWEKKEKQVRQRWEEIVNDETDADDEDSLSGGTKPVKSRSVEVIRSVKRSPPRG